MDKRKLILSTVFCFLALFSFAQNNRVYPLQTSNSIGALFPELNGWHGGLQVNGYTQQQFTGFEGRPQEYLIHGDVYIPKTKSSIGVFINQDILGRLRGSLNGLNYTHRLTIGEVNVLPSVGYQRNYFSGLPDWEYTGN